MNFIALFLSSLINRFRGGGLGSSHLPIKALWLSAIAFGLFAYFYHTIWISIGITLAYLLWALPPWGRWYDHGRLPILKRYATPFEVRVEAIAEKLARYIPINSDIIANFLRHLLVIPALVPLSIISGNPLYVLCGLPLAVLFVLSYEIGWRLWERKKSVNPILVAELLIGILWGVLVIV